MRIRLRKSILGLASPALPDGESVGHCQLKESDIHKIKALIYYFYLLFVERRSIIIKIYDLIDKENNGIIFSALIIE